MKFSVHDVVQRSPEWRQLRLGRVTSSSADDMLATRRDGKEAAGRRNLRVRLALERITGRSCEASSFQSDAMRQGIEREADAAAIYECLTARALRSVGFVSLPDVMAGYSPDGVIGEWEGLVEIKSPIPATHLDYLRTNEVPLEYMRQIQHALWVTDAAWCDFISWCPEFPDDLRTKLVRVHRDEKAIAAYNLSVRMFLSEVDKEIESIKALGKAAA